MLVAEKVFVSMMSAPARESCVNVTNYIGRVSEKRSPLFRRYFFASLNRSREYRLAQLVRTDGRAHRAVKDDDALTQNALKF